jgi:hypothetical protein
MAWSSFGELSEFAHLVALNLKYDFPLTLVPGRLLSA